MTRESEMMDIADDKETVKMIKEYERNEAEAAKDDDGTLELEAI